MQNRFKSKVLWISVTALVLLILNAAGLITNGQSATFTNVINAFLAALAGAGILNNPKDNTKF